MCAGFIRLLLRSPGGLVGGMLCAALLAVATLGPMIVRTDPSTPDIMQRLEPPGPAHLLGTDALGRDILSRVVRGARTSMVVSGAAVGAGLVVGAGLGVVAGYAGGAVEAVVMRSMDVLMAIPGFLLALLAVTVLGPGAANLSGALAIYSVPVFARVAHASALRLRNSEFVDASRALGAREARILWRAVVPNALSPILVQATLRLATTMLLASSVSFLGLGVQPPRPEWGQMLAEGRAYINTAPYVILFPGLAIMLAVLGVNLLGDTLRDALDPQYRRG